MAKQLEAFQVRLPPPHIEQLRREAECTGSSIGELIRRAVWLYLINRERERQKK